MNAVSEKVHALTGNETVLIDNVSCHVSLGPVSGLCGLIINMLTKQGKFFRFKGNDSLWNVKMILAAKLYQHVCFFI